jgi:peptide-methionine (S)-S-oxide reductase
MRNPLTALLAATLLAAALALAACTENGDDPVPKSPDTARPEGGEPAEPTAATAPQGRTEDPEARAKLATFGAGCFWCVEAIFQRLDGVLKVTSGYAGGQVESPTYQQVCSGTTGHAEVCQVRYDPEKISYADLLAVFFHVHDPTTPNRQGADVGTQYRSAIFFHDDEQKVLAEKAIREVDAAKLYHSPVVTEIVAYERFFPAEGYHQGYFDQNPDQGYCRLVIRPKIEKFQKLFAEKLR